MSYGGPPPAGYPGYGGPPQSAQYNQPPPPPQHPNMYHQQPYGAPPQGQYYQQPQPGSWQQPPAGYPPQGPPPGQWQQPPPPPHPSQGGYYGGHSPQPPNQPWGPPSPQPPQHYGAPSPQPPQSYGPPMGQPSGAYGAPQGPQAPPSPGYVQGATAPVDTSRDADALRSAMKGFGTDEKTLIRILAVNIPDPLVMASLRQTYNQRHRRDLVKDIEKETSGYFEEGLVALVRGPLEQDVTYLHDAMSGPGTKESVLNDILLGRTNADLNAIKALYHRKYGKSLEAAVRDELSLKTEKMFDIVLLAQRADESTQIFPQQLQTDVADLHRATEGKVGTDQMTVCNIFARRSDGQLRAISHEYHRQYHRPLKEVIRKEFSGHMEDALIRQLECAEDRVMADAESLEAAMRGAGTKDRLLINRLVRFHWVRGHMEQVNAAYRKRYRSELVERVKGETSGDYKRLACALVNPGYVV